MGAACNFASSTPSLRYKQRKITQHFGLDFWLPPKELRSIRALLPILWLGRWLVTSYRDIMC